MNVTRIFISANYCCRYCIQQYQNKVSKPRRPHLVSVVETQAQRHSLDACFAHSFLNSLKQTVQKYTHTQNAKFSPGKIPVSYMQPAVTTENGTVG